MARAWALLIAEVLERLAQELVGRPICLLTIFGAVGCGFALLAERCILLGADDARLLRHCTDLVANR